MSNTYRHLARVNGRTMNPVQIADYIYRTTGATIAVDTVRERMRRGFKGKDLVAPVIRRKPKYTHTIEGVEMGPSEISDWLQEHRGHYVSPTTLRARMEQGQTGERLLRKSRQKNKPAKARTYPQLPRISVPGWGVRVG